MLKTVVDAGAPIDEMRPNDATVFHSLIASIFTDVPTMKWMCDRYKKVFGEKKLLRALSDECFETDRIAKAPAFLS